MRLHALAAATALASAGAAHAAVTMPAGGFGVADYGNGGNVFQTTTSLSIGGLGSADDPLNVVALNPDLSFSETVSGWGSGLVTWDYRVTNTGAAPFNTLRFMFFANPDGDQDFFADSLAETWPGVVPAGNPVRREGREFTFNPLDSITARFRANGQLTEAPSPIDAACGSPSSCDAVLGLEWNEATLGPGEIFHVRVGLSDDGQALSVRWIDAVAGNSPNTALRISGMSAVVPIPEPGAIWMMAAGLGLLGFVARRRGRR